MIFKNIANPFGISQRDFCFLLIAVIFCSCNPKLDKTTAEEFKQTVKGQTQGTTYSVAYYDLKERNLKTQIDSVLARIDESISTYRSGSIVDQWNKSEHGANVDALFVEVLCVSWNVYAATDGAFNPAIKPLVSHWGFGTEKFDPPEDIDSSKVAGLLGLAQ